MAERKKKAKRKAPKKSKALVIRQIQLSKEQKLAIAQRTPAHFVKTRPGRGNKKLSYVEGGYVIAQLNRIFGPLNWSFKIVERIDDKTGISVLGRLTVHDHAKGYEVSKEQWGGSAFKDKIPESDVRKAATTDSLKKCASFGFGIALDIYYPDLDLDGNDEMPTDDNQKPNGMKKAKGVKITDVKTKPKVRKMAYSINAIKSETDPVLLRELERKVKGSQHYTAAEKANLILKINAKIGK